MLAPDFGRDLSGCEISVEERVGLDTEGFEIHLCRDGTLHDCVEPPAAFPMGGHGTARFGSRAVSYGVGVGTGAGSSSPWVRRSWTFRSGS